MTSFLHFLQAILIVTALTLCAGAWRLGQGPIDVTWLLRREQARLSIQGATLRIGRATLAWEGLGAHGEPLDIRLSDVVLSAPGDGPQGRVREAGIGLPIGPLLLGRISARHVTADGLDLHVQRRADGTLALGQKAGAPLPGGNGGGLSWPPRLVHLRVSDATMVVHDAALGVEWQAHGVSIEAKRHRDGTADGEARAALLAGDVPATLVLRATQRPDGTRVTASLSPIDPAALARVTPALAALSALDAPVTLSGTAELGADLLPRSARLDMLAGPGTLAAGKGSTALRGLRATLWGDAAELHLDGLRIAFAQPAGTSAQPPTFTGQATATRAARRLHVAFALDEDAVSMADLARYWPAGTGGGSRAWLVQNVTGGRVHDGHVSGALDAPMDFSDVTLTALSGGASFEDATLWWLRPVPPLVHAAGHLVIEGPDSLRVTMDRGGQDRLVLAPGSSIHITKLEEPHQFGDIAAGLSGPLADALALLNHPRLKLLSRGNVDVRDPAGDVRAKLTLRIPLEDRVTMDQIAVGATATLAGVHLGGVVGGRDLDRGALSLGITGDGLDLGGTGAISGIPADLALHMDFRAGPPDQVLQHLTVSGDATAAQLAGAGVPATVAAILTGGQAGLRIDYAGHRDGTAAIQVDADLARAALATPIGWSKAVGPPASAGGRVLLDHGRLAGVDGLRAAGPGLAIASRARLPQGGTRVLLLDRFQLGQTDAHGRIAFPGGAKAPLDIRLAGPMLDASAYLERPSPKPGAKPAPEDDTPGPPWAVDLAFDRVQLARGEVAAPFSLKAASDGTRILHAEAEAGRAGELAARITPDRDGRAVSISAANAGLVLRAAGVADNLRGGSLKLDGRYDDSQPGSPLAGTATLDRFQLTQAPAIGRLLQAMTLYGLTDALRGPGLRFSKLVAPFRWHRRVLHLASARAFSPSLGLTAQGDIDLRRHVADVTGTVVPAYFFNQLLGDLPLIGRVFSPEKGGGVFAARYAVRGPLANPKVGVNPLSALTPGFLREGFGLFSPAGCKGSSAPQDCH